MTEGCSNGRCFRLAEVSTSDPLLGCHLGRSPLSRLRCQLLGCHLGRCFCFAEVSTGDPLLGCRLGRCFCFAEVSTGGASASQRSPPETRTPIGVPNSFYSRLPYRGGVTRYVQCLVTEGCSNGRRFCFAEVSTLDPLLGCRLGRSPLRQLRCQLLAAASVDYPSVGFADSFSAAASVGASASQRSPPETGTPIGCLNAERLIFAPIAGITDKCQYPTARCVPH